MQTRQTRGTTSVQGRANGTPCTDFLPETLRTLKTLSLKILSPGQAFMNNSVELHLQKTYDRLPSSSQNYARSKGTQVFPVDTYIDSRFFRGANAPSWRKCRSCCSMDLSDNREHRGNKRKNIWTDARRIDGCIPHDERGSSRALEQ